MSNIDLTNLRKEIAYARKQADDKEAVLAKIEALLERFPDLNLYKTRWKTEFLWAPSALPLCTDFDSRRTCGCCADAGYCLTPYVDIDGTRVWGWSPSMEFGEGDYDWFYLHRNWQDRIPEDCPSELRERIVQHLESKADRVERAREILHGG